MPIYEYRCRACGEKYEKMVKVGADAPPCPNCGAEDAKKLISASGFVLKGSGWYRDHYGLKSGGSGSGSDSGGSGSSGSGSSGGSSSGGSSSGGSSSGGSSSGGSSASATS